MPTPGLHRVEDLKFQQSLPPCKSINFFSKLIHHLITLTIRCRQGLPSLVPSGTRCLSELVVPWESNRRATPKHQKKKKEKSVNHELCFDVMVVGRISSERVTRVRGGDYLLLLLCNCTYCPFITDLKHLRYDVYIQPMIFVGTHNYPYQARH